MKRKIEISLEKARELYGKSQLLDECLLETFTHEELTKKELPKKWEELESIGGYYVSSASDIIFVDMASYRKMKPTDYRNRNIWPTKELAEASLAMSQLAQLREVYRDGWKPDREVADNKKYMIDCYENVIVKYHTYTIQYFLSFQTEEIRDEFYDNFRDLIKKAKPLL